MCSIHPVLSPATRVHGRQSTSLDPHTYCFQYSQKMGSGHERFAMRLGFMWHFVASFPGSLPVGHVTCRRAWEWWISAQRLKTTSWYPSVTKSLSFCLQVWLHKSRLQMKYIASALVQLLRRFNGAQSSTKHAWKRFYLDLHTHLTTTCSYACAKQVYLRFNPLLTA